MKKLLLSKPDFAFTAPWLVGGLAVLALSFFALRSSSFTHFGTLQPTSVTPLDAVQSESEFVYEARIRGAQNIFRGNDLFRITKVAFPESLALLEEHWDAYGKGVVVFSTAEPLAQDTELPVVFLLQPRWEKLLEVSLKAFLLLLAIQLLVYRKQLPELLHNPWFSIFIGLVTLGSVLCFLIAIVGWPGWVYGDTHQFLETTIQGEFACMPVTPETGRFFPFAFLDLNLLIPFGNAPQAYHIERAIFFLLTVTLLYRSAKYQVGKTAAAVLVLLFLTSPKLIIIYGEPIFAEAVISFLLAWFLFLYFRVQDVPRLGDLIGCALIASYACYCKEPVFLFFTVFAAIQLTFGRAQLNLGQKYLNAYLLCNSLVFLIFYFVFCGNFDANYATRRSAFIDATYGSTFLDFAKTHLMVWLVVATAVIRFFSLLISRASKCVNFDAVLFGGVAYFAAFVVLKMPSPYLIIPAYIPWLVALSGYLGLQFSNVFLPIENVKTKFWFSFASSIQSSRLLPAILLAAMLVLVMLQFDRSANEIKQHHREREVTKQACRFFANLSDRGFRMFVLYPEEAGFRLELAKFRHQVLNMFDSAFRGQEIKQTVPFQDLVIPALDKLKGSCLVIVDPIYSPTVANPKFMLNRGFRLVRDAPTFRGELIYVSETASQFK